ncbi:MAG: NAD(P)/FAD-dependent oxidoreductase [Alphaproteobacteria bacterium]|nr:NAD(P)/FAD-dependent oxidoreductase [Alphaproteobacteria bacterium]
MSDMAVEVLVIGGGAVGLAITRRLAMEGHDVLLIDSNESFGMETSSRNSEVIHAGMYYPQGSLKAQLCVKGARMMYDFCAAHGVETRNYGKLIVATSPDQLERLQAIKSSGDANGTPGLRIVEGDELRAMEPKLNAVAALYSPLTGVVDSHNYMLALAGDAEHHGATIAYLSRFIKAEAAGAGYRVEIDSQGEVMTLDCARIINTAGHGARQVASAIDGSNPDAVPPHYMAKRQYFTTSKRPPVSHLIYPMPSGGGLGIHLTLDNGGGARFGPDIQWVDALDYEVNPDDRAKFHASISSYWPELEPDDLTPAWAGVRPKIVADGSVFQDFTIHHADTHGAEGVTCLYGIDSPGLTSSLALGDHVGGHVMDAMKGTR